MRCCTSSNIQKRRIGSVLERTATMLDPWQRASRAMLNALQTRIEMVQSARPSLEPYLRSPFTSRLSTRMHRLGHARLSRRGAGPRLQ